MLELTAPIDQAARSDAAGGFVAAMATVARHSADLFVLVDGDGVLLYANPAAIATFGVPLEDAIGTNAISYLHRTTPCR
jgi:PAS domain-containing protein